MLHLLQSLNEQVRNLKKQKVEQQQRVKDAAPDAKTLKNLEKTVAEHRKGTRTTVAVLFSLLFYPLAMLSEGPVSEYN